MRHAMTTTTSDDSNDANAGGRLVPMPWWRALLALAGGVAAGGGLMVMDRGTPPAVIFLLAAALALSGVASRLRWFPAQLAGRAVLWQGWVLGALILIHGLTRMGWYDRRGMVAGAILLTGATAALGALWRSGLDTPGGRFAPAAFRMSLIVSLVAALADTQALLLYSGVLLESPRALSHTLSTIAPLLLSAGAMSLAIVGVYRLRVWGVALNILTNIVVATCAITGLFDLPKILAVGFVATAVLQLLIPVPMLRAMARR